MENNEIWDEKQAKKGRYSNQATQYLTPTVCYCKPGQKGQNLEPCIYSYTKKQDNHNK